MPYPLSSPVSAGDKTAASHYNNLRADAILLGQLAADTVTLAALLARYSRYVTLQSLATNRIRVPFSTNKPPALVINGVMCVATANVDLASSSFSGGAATWYIFAKKTAGATTFTLVVATSASEGSDTRLIGSVTWTGTALDYTTLTNLVSDGPDDLAFTIFQESINYLGKGAANAVQLTDFLKYFKEFISLEFLIGNKFRCPYVSTRRPTINIKGFMCQSTANVDSAACSGGAGKRYVFAERAPDSTTFTLTISTSNTESANNRLIGEGYYDGTTLLSNSIKVYGDPAFKPNYDSGWFAVAYENTYSLVHNLGTQPFLVIVYHSTTAGGGTWVQVHTVGDGYSFIGVTATNINITTASSSGTGTLKSTIRTSGGGYYRVFAWA